MLGYVRADFSPFAFPRLWVDFPEVNSPGGRGEFAAASLPSHAVRKLCSGSGCGCRAATEAGNCLQQQPAGGRGAG